ncbi:D-xylulose kinase [Gracilariopsis chorda]|uniref:glycerol kinase n=1 Tax=Gracilariopsis chorda TaxID=448386 RepID=A0A2V3IXZ8_9FLOR|nr:D-xylulose kinase [Gracilariopsis chorda]|eukprot:PXF47024.1 D-xylulose kinase [Gracilariopsis chorda]
MLFFATPAPVKSAHLSSSVGSRLNTRGTTRPKQSALMSMDDEILAIDVGTSATKAALYCPAYSSLARVSRHTHDTYAHGFAVTQRPSNWLSAALSACSEVLRDARNVTAISVTGQMQDLIGVGDVPDLLKDQALLYSDARAVDEATRLSQVTGAEILPTDLLSKLSLLPCPSGQDYILLIGGADFICYEFTGRPNLHFTDATTAATTGLTQHPHRKYNTELFKQAGLSSFIPLLPEIVPRPIPVGRLCARIANRIGRPELAGIPVVHSGGDAFSVTVGAGCGVVGSGCYVYGGSSGWVGKTIGADSNNLAALGLAHAAVDSATIVAGSVAAIGACLSHASATFLQCTVSDLSKLAEQSDIGAAGVIYVPYITGRRCPPARAVGTLHGLTASCNRGDIARAILEGLVFSLFDASEGMQCGEVSVVGGVTESSVFVNGISAMFGGAKLQERDVGVLGAGIIGAEALGLDTMDESVGSLYRVPEKERTRWMHAFKRWKQIVSHMEAIW